LNNSEWNVNEATNENSTNKIRSEPRDWSQEINKIKEDKRLKRNYFKNQRDSFKSNEQLDSNRNG
jgi:aspartyl/asparaginyl beta-hydroxylase (cupin superfamily)